jgi:uncharacterized RDD family membrane protein YckC
LDFDQVRDAVSIGGAQITFEHLAEYDRAGQIAWATAEWRDWSLRRSLPPALPNPIIAHVNSESTSVTGRRVGAFLLDVLLVNLLQVPLAVPVVALSSSQTEATEMARLLGLLVAAAYFVIAETVWGRTPGKAMLGIRVVNTAGARIDFGQSLGRNAARFIDLLLWGIPAFLSISRSPLHQRLGDKWAGTVVVRG